MRRPSQGLGSRPGIAGPRPAGTLAAMGLAQIKMPQLGESVTEGTVDHWLKNEGDFVKRDEPLVEVVTDKVNAEIPSPFEGKLVQISVSEGETVRVGSVIGQIEVAGAGTPAAAAPAAGVAAREAPAAAAASVPGFRLPCASWRPSTGSTPPRCAGPAWAAASRGMTCWRPSAR